jgi:hypothetical protein
VVVPEASIGWGRGPAAGGSFATRLSRPAADTLSPLELRGALIIADGATIEEPPAKVRRRAELHNRIASQAV